MPHCDYCGEEVPNAPLFTCNHCGQSHCAQHQLPENHDCPGLAISDPSNRDLFSSDGSLGGTADSRNKRADQEDTQQQDRGHAGKRHRDWEPGSRSPEVTVDRSEQQSSNDGKLPLRWRAKRGYTKACRKFWLYVPSPKSIILLAVVLFALLFLIGNIGGIGVAPVDRNADRTVGAVNTTIATVYDSSTTGQQGYNRSKVEQEFLQQYNQMRRDRGLSPAKINPELTEMGNAQAANMAEHDYIGHEQPDGTTIEDRYSDRGLLPKCEMLAGGQRFYPGAENAAGAHVNIEVTHSGTDRYWDINDEETLANFLMDSWMSSDGHRRVMVLDAVDEIGLGLAIRDDGEVFAALEFC